MASKQLKRILFGITLLLLLIDRSTSLYLFNFKYSDIDQLVMWNGAMNYSQGLFHEPYFYGQPYNYMLEALLAVPLILFKIPIYQALPVTTACMSIMPFVILAFLFYRKDAFFWSLTTLAIAIFLPIEYNFITSIPRGFVQAFVLLPILFFSVLYPTNKKYLLWTFLCAGACFILNQSSILVLVPVIVYIGSFHFRSTSFYYQFLWIVPFLIIDYFSKYYYTLHPEKVLLEISGMELDFDTFLHTLSNPSSFPYLLPFQISNIYVYLLGFSALCLIALRTKNRKAGVFSLASILILLVSFAIPKVQAEYPVPNAGVFFTVSRFYITLPIMLLLACYLTFSQYKVRLGIYISIPLLSIVCFWFKFSNIQTTVENTIHTTSFPVCSNKYLAHNVRSFEKVVQKHQVDLVVFAANPAWDWKNIYTAYAYSPLTFLNNNKTSSNVIAVNFTGDRRTWLYTEAQKCNRILVVGKKFSEQELKNLKTLRISENTLYIKNMFNSPQQLLKKLNTDFGILNSK
jgi:hypothetical protein